MEIDPLVYFQAESAIPVKGAQGAYVASYADRDQRAPVKDVS
jgi:hypothetical protein